MTEQEIKKFEQLFLAEYAPVYLFFHIDQFAQIELRDDAEAIAMAENTPGTLLVMRSFDKTIVWNKLEDQSSIPPIITSVSSLSPAAIGLFIQIGNLYKEFTMKHLQEHSLLSERTLQDILNEWEHAHVVERIPYHIAHQKKYRVADFVRQYAEVMNTIEE